MPLLLKELTTKQGMLSNIELMRFLYPTFTVEKYDAYLTEIAMKDPCTLFNPRKPKFEEIKAILQACYDGTIVNF